MTRTNPAPAGTRSPAWLLTPVVSTESPAGSPTLGTDGSSSGTTPGSTPASPELQPWPALWAMCLGFFMILVDTTIVTVATPALVEDLQADVNAVVWVTSAYLLGYAVPVLITGRLGDRYGPKRVYLLGLAVFTLASLACGLTSTIEWLVAARVLQGLGASMMTPQTMTVITRIFPIQRRGSAMALWGATAGVATLVGPILGGVLVDHLGWEWIFFINIPVGIVAMVLAWRLVPTLETHAHSFDWLGVALSGVGMFLLVFGIQEGEQYDWSVIAGPVTVWRLIITGAIVLTIFVLWQSRNRREPLVPLSLFADRNFSVSNIAIGTVSFAFLSMGFPLMLWAQLVRGYSPTESGLLLAPMAVMSIVTAPISGRLTDRVHPRLLTTGGFVVVIAALVLLAAWLSPDTPLWQVALTLALLGLGSSFLWGPLATTANRNLAMARAGAGSGVYNATRQVGAALGAAVIAVMIDARLRANGLTFDPAQAHGSGGTLPPEVAGAFTEAMAESLLVLPVVLVLGLLAVLAFERPRHFGPR